MTQAASRAKTAPPATPVRRLLTPLNLMLLALPAAVALKLAGAPPLWLFVGAGLGLVPLAGLIGKGTEAVAERLGAGVGSLLNATFANAAELVIALVMLAHGPELYPVVKATITGSILGNLLLVLGLAVLAGGVRYPEQHFNRASAGVGTTLLTLACAGLIIPTLFYHLPHSAAGRSEAGVQNLEGLSDEIAGVLLAVYLLSLLFSLRTHRQLFCSESEPNHAAPREGPRWGIGRALAVLVAATAGVAVLSEWLVDAVGPAAQLLGMNDVFVGVVVVAVLGNAAENSTAVLMARRDRMDLAVGIAVGSSTQVALFVAPVLVFASLLMGHARPLDLHFSPLEVVGMVLAVVVVSMVARDGKTNWLEGAMLLGLYAILAFAFYHLPMPSD